MNWLPIALLMLVCLGMPVTLWLAGDADLGEDA